MTLGHIAATGAGASITYAQSGFDGIYVGERGAANDITADIRTGELAGLISMRDSVLPDLQSSLDALAAQLRDTVNVVHNRGVAFPGLAEMSGTRVFSEPATQTITFGGTSDTVLALFDGNGNEVRHTTLRTLLGGAAGGQHPRRCRHARHRRRRRSNRYVARRRRNGSGQGRPTGYQHQDGRAEFGAPRSGDERQRQRPAGRRNPLRRRRRRCH
jgi:hypothetical protein